MTGDEGVACIMTEWTYIPVLKRFVHQMLAEPSQWLCRLRRKERCMSNVWQVQEAKARFSEMLETSLSEGPQVVTKQCAETAVFVPIEQWRRMERMTKSLI